MGLRFTVKLSLRFKRRHRFIIRRHILQGRQLTCIIKAVLNSVIFRQKKKLIKTNLYTTADKAAFHWIHPWVIQIQIVSGNAKHIENETT